MQPCVFSPFPSQTNPQVLSHLLSNAAKFTPASGPRGGAEFTPAGEVVVGAEVEDVPAGDPGAPPARRLHFTVRDSGIGVPPEAMHKLFQCFRQGNESLSRTYGGTGAEGTMAL